jgi:hypothetical protein
MQDSYLIFIYGIFVKNSQLKKEGSLLLLLGYDVY